ncbi:MAG: hypothetical protein ABL967_03395 [Bryobacteraceae bacterium]
MQGKWIRQGLWLSAAILCCGTAMADDAASRAKIAGVWEGENNGFPSRWTLENKGDSVHLVYQEKNEKLIDFECSTLGKECSTKVDGKGAKMTLYYNGPLLVVMESKGAEVATRRFGVDASGDQLSVDWMPLVPSGKDSTVQYKRVKEQASAR